MSYVLFDIGGTKTRVSVSDDLRTFSTPHIISTPDNFAEGVDEVVAAVKKLTKSPITAVAGGIRGQLSEDKKSLAYDHLLQGWIAEPLADTLKKKLHAEVYLENDAALAALGEATYGAGEGFDIVAYHTVGTGVGGAKVSYGNLDEVRGSFEPGHQILDIDQTILGDGVSPTLENLVSGSALEARIGIPPYEIPQEDSIWDQLAYYLAYGLRNSILFWSPDIVVLGGSMITGDPRIQIDDIIRHTNTVVGEVTEVPLIKQAALGDSAGLYGAMALLNQRM